MEIATLNKNVTSGGIQRKKTFGIQEGRFLFRILIKQYKNPIHSAIRETWTNAEDARIEAGSTRPADVQLPTNLDPTFKIRDYGTGISLQNIEDLYGVAGKSSKNHSNEYNGGWGIGKLAMLAVVQQFSLTSYYNGEKHLCIVALNENDVPELNFIDSLPTDEPNGLEISCAVLNTDINKFKDEAKNVFEYADLRPNFTGIKVHWDDIKYFMEGPGFKIKEGNTTPGVVMGWIKYPLDVYQFDYSVQNMLTGSGIEFYLDIGEVDIVPARDNLEYTDKTLQTLKDKLAQIKKYIEQKLKDSLKDCKNLYEARVLYNTISSGKLAYLVDRMQVKWNGQVVSRAYVDFPYDNQIDGVKLDWKKFPGGGLKSSKRYYSNTVHIQENMEFVYNDLDKGAQARCIHLDNPSILANDQDTKDKICELFGFDDSYFVNASTLPAPPKVQRGPSTKRAANFEYYTPPSSSFYTGTWHTPTKIADVKTGDFIYVGRYRNAVLGKDWNSYGSIDSVCYQFNQLINLPPIYGVRPHQKKKIEGLTNWIHLSDWLTTSFKQYIKAKKIEEQISFKQTYDKLQYTENLNLLQKTFNKIGWSSDLATFIKTIEDKNRKQNKDLLLVETVASLLKYNIEYQSHQDLLEEEKKLYEKYPILSVCRKNYYVEEGPFIQTLKFMIDNS